jgi:hypothetical protein
VFPFYTLWTRGTRAKLSFFLTRLVNGISRRRDMRHAARRRLLISGLEERVVPSNFTETEPNNTQATANVVAIATGDILTTAPSDWLTIIGSVASSSDFDYFQFTLSSISGVFFDLDSRETGLSTTLNADIHLFNSSTTEIANNNDGFDFEGFTAPPLSTGLAFPDSSLYMELGAGTYAIRVQSVGAVTNAPYHLRLLADSIFASSVPVFQSVPGAADTLYLDFDGHSASDAWGTYSAAAYDLNSAPAQFSPGERLAIFNAWRVTSEDFSSFNINVTTATPGTIANGVGQRHVITNSDSNAIPGQPSGILGVAFVGAYGGFQDNDNVSFTFAGNFPVYGGVNPLTSPANNSSRIMAIPLEIGNTTSHEFGHSLGLRHYRTSQNPNPGDIIPNAIMATPDEGLNREIWATGVIEGGGSTQDDMAVISGAGNTFGYRPDDHGGTTATATQLTTSTNTYNATGRIEQITDADFFKFVASGTTTITVDVFDYVNNLDTILRLRDSNGSEIGINNPAGSFDSTITQTLSNGTYYVDVRGTGLAGIAGQYSLRIDTTVLQAPVLSGIESAALAYQENQILPVTSTLVVTDSDSTDLSGATVAITGNFVAAEDQLLFTNQNGITGNFSGGILTLTGTSSVANYQTALRSVQYQNTSDAPSTATRTVTFQVTDTTSMTSNTQARNITVTPVNDAPVLDNTGNMALADIAEDAFTNSGTLIASRTSIAGPSRASRSSPRIRRTARGNTRPTTAVLGPH